MDRETIIALVVLLLILVLAIKIIRGIFQIIKWILKSIRFIFTGRRAEDPTPSNDWLTRAQAKQEIRFNNSLPPLRSEAKPQKKTFREKWNEKHGRSATGWTFNEETQLWEPPRK